jgi:hypothetical protein
MVMPVEKSAAGSAGFSAVRLAEHYGMVSGHGIKIFLCNCNIQVIKLFSWQSRKERRGKIFIA